MSAAVPANVVTNPIKKNNPSIYKMKSMKILTHKLILPAIGAIVGAIGGYLYWKWVGCSSGTCAITSKPLNSSIYFAIMGALLFSLFQKKEMPNQ